MVNEINEDCKDDWCERDLLVMEGKRSEKSVVKCVLIRKFMLGGWKFVIFVYWCW